MTEVHTIRLWTREKPKGTARCTCGQPLMVLFQTAPVDGSFPITTISKRCTRCGRPYRFTVEGYRRNPTGDAPILESGAVINMASLLRCLALPSPPTPHGID